jgi:hypothetical protein
VALSVVLAFGFRYALTMRPLLRAGLPLARATRLALAADTLSIAVMEIVDNGIMLLVPGAMDAHLDQPLFWGSLLLALAIAGVAAYPVNRWLIGRGRGHALVHRHHAIVATDMARPAPAGRDHRRAPPVGPHPCSPSPNREWGTCGRHQAIQSALAVSLRTGLAVSRRSTRSAGW